MLSMTVETITPKKAAEYLKTNIDNPRKLSRSTVVMYAEEIRNGRWALNGEAICFGEDGKLKNGQHRLAGIVMAKKSIETVVVRGVANDVTAYDIGKKRTITDIANAEHIDCNSTVAAVASIIVGKFSGKARGAGERMDYIRKNIDELNRAYRVCCYGNGKTTKTAPCVAASYLMLRTQSLPVYEAELFFRLMNDPYFTQADGYDISPVTVATKQLEDRRSSGTGIQLQKERLEIVCLAMRDFHEGKHREKAYKLGEPFYFMTLLDQVRKNDQVEG